VGRYLCSELVVLRTVAGESVVNLEEIWREGAVFESENPLEAGWKVELQCGGMRLHGVAAEVELHDFGCRVEMQFSPLTLWDPERFAPKHLLDLSFLGPEEAAD